MQDAKQQDASKTQQPISVRENNTDVQMGWISMYACSIKTSEIEIHKQCCRMLLYSKNIISINKSYRKNQNIEIAKTELQYQGSLLFILTSHLISMLCRGIIFPRLHDFIPQKNILWSWWGNFYTWIYATYYGTNTIYFGKSHVWDLIKIYEWKVLRGYILLIWLCYLWMRGGGTTLK